RGLRRQLPAVVLCARRLWPGRPGPQHGAGHAGARGRSLQSEESRQHVEQFELESLRRGVRFRRRGSVVRVFGKRRQDDDRRLCRTAARERPGRAGRRRPARALFPAGGGDRHQRIRHPRRPKPPRGRADDLRPVACDQRDQHRRAGPDAVEADAALGSAGPKETSAAHRAVHRDVRSDLRAGLGRDDVAHGAVEQLELERVGRFDDPRRRHRRERPGDQQFNERLHRRFDSDVLRRADGEPAEVLARGLSESEGAEESPRQATRPKVRRMRQAPLTRAAATRADSTALYEAACRLWREGRREEVIARLDDALRRRPDFAEALSMGGYMLSQCGKPEAALRFYRQAVTLDPSLVVAHLNAGKILFDMGRFAEALVAFETASILAPADADAWCSRAGALREVGRLEDSLEAAQRALALRPDFAEAAINLGNAFLKLDRIEEALAAYRRAGAARPGFAPALCGEGLALRNLGRFDDALAAFEAAAALDSREAVAGKGCLLL